MIITGGKYKGQKIIAPDEKITRPTLSKVRMAVFNTLQSMIDFEGKSFFDMYAGSGIMGLEALSRGFCKLYSCEKNKTVFTILKKNFEKYNSKDEIKLVLADSNKYTESVEYRFDVTYVDPPYRIGIYEESLKSLKGKSDIIVIEHISPLDFKDFELLKQKKYGDKIISFVKSIP